MITSLRDGMNLVAKEFTAAQNPDDPGALVLSTFAGAARELKDAILVNPYDIENMAEGIAKAIEMPMHERRRRWESNMQVLRKNDITAWRRGFINMLRDCAADKIGPSWQNRLSGPRYVAPTVDYLQTGSAIHKHVKSVVTSTTRPLKSS
ncbi:MAG: trehalose-6-phosphate synthase [Gammaproteobacteria bacterium]